VSVETYRAEREAALRRDAEQSGTVAAWAIRKGAVEVRRQVDDDAVFEALRLLRSVDPRRYVKSPEIKAALTAAVDAVSEAAMATTERLWAEFKADADRGSR
jgi:hypothetical protein